MKLLCNTLKTFFTPRTVSDIISYIEQGFCRRTESPTNPACVKVTNCHGKESQYIRLKTSETFHLTLERRWLQLPQMNLLKLLVSS
jgi:hypothetical protein